jgi:membrane-associated phospholipid phosphatase
MSRRMQGDMKHYTFIDYATQGYLALVALFILLLHGDTVPAWQWLVTGHLICLGLAHWVIVAHAARPTNRLLDFLRHFYPVLLYTAFYRETGELNQMLHHGYIDALFVRLDGWIFGFQPSIKLMDWFPYPLVSEIFYISYFSYYVMIVGVGLALYLRDRRQFFHYVSVVSFVFYICYLIYIFTPVIGPRMFYRDFNGFTLPAALIPPGLTDVPESIQAGWFFQIMKWIYHYFEAYGSAFPSSHVAIALTTVYFSFKYLRRIRWLHLVVAILLCLSTVYCRYHYAVDVLAGAATAAILIPMGEWLYRRYGGNEATAAVAQ